MRNYRELDIIIEKLETYSCITSNVICDTETNVQSEKCDDIFQELKMSGCNASSMMKMKVGVTVIQNLTTFKRLLKKLKN